MTDVVLEINNILRDYLSGNKNIAYNKLKRISKKYPTNEKIRFNLAFMEQDQGNVQKAKKSYLNLINDFNNFNAKINLYNIYLKEKNYHKALDLIDNILEIKDDLINVHIDKAASALVTGTVCWAMFVLGWHEAPAHLAEEFHTQWKRHPQARHSQSREWRVPQSGPQQRTPTGVPLARLHIQMRSRVRG